MNSFSLKGILAEDSVYFLNQYLEKLDPNSKIYLRDEPIYMYATSRSPPIRCLKILLDDPRLHIDADFIANHLYWLPDFAHSVLLDHPRCQEILKKEKFFMQHFDKRYPDGEFFGFSNLARRYYKVSKIIDEHNQRKRWRMIAFSLVPFLTRWIRTFKMHYYGIGGKGYEKAKERFIGRLREYG